jgi:hypothetical protein
MQGRGGPRWCAGPASTACMRGGFFLDATQDTGGNPGFFWQLVCSPPVAEDVGRGHAGRGGRRASERWSWRAKQRWPQRRSTATQTSETGMEGSPRACWRRRKGPGKDQWLDAVQGRSQLRHAPPETTAQSPATVTVVPVWRRCQRRQGLLCPEKGVLDEEVRGASREVKRRVREGQQRRQPSPCCGGYRRRRARTRAAGRSWASSRSGVRDLGVFRGSMVKGGEQGASWPF